MSDVITIKEDNLRAIINPKNGQLISLSLDKLEFFHDGGSPHWKGQGWNSSEMVPYPVFGSVPDYLVAVGGRKFTLDQHGISRNTEAIPFNAVEITESAVSVMQIYHGEDILNCKFKLGNGRPEKLNWLPYELQKRFRLEHSQLFCEITLKNISETEMPYILGWHPSFKVLGEVKDGVFLDDDNNPVATLEQVIQHSISEGAQIITEMGPITYKNVGSNLGIRISSHDYGRGIILWSPSREAGMFCMEHATQLPNSRKDYFNDGVKCERLAPGEQRTYVIVIQPIK